ncbi:coiled-coil domain-containing protein 201-like [Rhincodon typus]|uniref:coiled-coil domain-containing protein 201-like n=1 Tax=Rhincodon typus TaxID=259920 RepID=UPI00202F45B4|nr:coiled-coil domain-containing protein 201-like [Rhincodon typus]
MSEEETPFINVELLTTGLSSSVKCSTPELSYLNRENLVGKTIELSRIEYDSFETQKMLRESVLFKSGIPTISPISKFVNPNYESFEESPSSPENTRKPRIINNDNYKIGTKSWNTVMSSKSTYSKGANLSTILEESQQNVALSETEQIHKSSTTDVMDDSTAKEIDVEDGQTIPASLKLFSKNNTDEILKDQSKSLSPKSPERDSSYLGKSISVKKRYRKKKIPIEQKIRIKEWTIRQLINIEEATKHELIVEAD